MGSTPIWQSLSIFFVFFAVRLSSWVPSLSGRWWCHRVHVTAISILLVSVFPSPPTSQRVLACLRPSLLFASFGSTDYLRHDHREGDGALVRADARRRCVCGGDARCDGDGRSLTALNHLTAIWEYS